jgi:hypothetical protein
LKAAFRYGTLTDGKKPKEITVECEGTPFIRTDLTKDIYSTAQVEIFWRCINRNSFEYALHDFQVFKAHMHLLMLYYALFCSLSDDHAQLRSLFILYVDKCK